MAASKGVYGEAAGEWTPTDALGFSKIVALTGMFHRRAGEGALRHEWHENRRRRQDRLGHAGLRPVARGAHRRPTFPPRKAWWWSSRCSPTSPPTTRSSSRAGAWPRSARATSSSARSAIARRCSATRATCRSRSRPGDVIQMLNIGGVLGICDSVNPDKGKPFDCRVLGVVLQFPYLGERIGVPARVGYKPLDYERTLDTRGVPVVALAGTCMEAGKTAAACAIVSRMRHRGLVVDAFKATGVSLRRDILAMEDAGARQLDDLHRFRRRHDHSRERPGAHAHHADASWPRASRTSSCSSWATASSARTASMRSSSARTSAAALTRRRAVRERSGRRVGRRQAAARALRHRAAASSRARPPTTRSACEIIEQQIGVPAFNAMSDGAALGDRVIEAVGLESAEPARQRRRPR